MALPRRCMTVRRTARPARPPALTRPPPVHRAGPAKRAPRSRTPALPPHCPPRLAACATKLRAASSDAASCLGEGPAPSLLASEEAWHGGDVILPAGIEIYLLKNYWGKVV